MFDQNIRVLGIPGSLRSNSYNRGLLIAAQEVAPPGMEIEIFDLHTIPFFNADVEAKGTPESVLAFHKQLKAADAYIFASPEYNYSVTGVLKNAIDWASRKGNYDTAPISSKPALIMGAGGRYGTLRSQLHLREILIHNDLHILNQALMVPFAGKHFDRNGALTDEAMRQRLERLLLQFNDWTIKLQKTPQVA